MSEHDHRHGAKQPEIFSVERAARLDAPEREEWFPTGVFLDHLNPPRNATVLDVGTGTGRYALALAHARPDIKVIAFDVQPEMLAILETRAREQALANITTTLTLPEAPVARIFAVNLLHEIGDADLRALAPLLAPQGEALFLDWSGDAPRPVGPPAEHVHTAHEAQARLLRCGFRAVERIDEPRFPYHFALRAWGSLD